MKLCFEFDGFDRIEILWRFETKFPFFPFFMYFSAYDETRDLFQLSPSIRVSRDTLWRYSFVLFSVIEEENVAQSRGKQWEENVESLLNDEPGKKISRCNFLMKLLNV